MSSILSVAYEYIFSGTVAHGGSWGGEECGRAVDRETHVKEASTWLVICAALYFMFDIRGRVAAIKTHVARVVGHHVKDRYMTARVLDAVLAFICFFMWFQVIYYKINKRSLVNLFAPCHIVLLTQGIILASPPRTSVLLTVFSLCMVTGTGLAVLFPDTSGLDQPFERVSYWIQHYLVQVVPLYLLARFDFAALKCVSIDSLLIGNWGIWLAHWIFYEPMDYIFLVNVEFMLCPTPAMVFGMSAFPDWVANSPSYRTFLSVSLFFLAIPVSWAYVLVMRAVRAALGKRDHDVAKSTASSTTDGTIADGIPGHTKKSKK